VVPRLNASVGALATAVGEIQILAHGDADWKIPVTIVKAGR